jgi:hypothetical protein
MNGRLIAYLLAFAAVAFGTVAWQQARQDKAARVQLALLNTQAEIVARHVEQAERLKRERAEIALLEEELAAQELRVRGLRQDMERLRGSHAKLRQDFDHDIAGVRAASVGMALGNLVLPSGVSLRECRIQRVEDSGLLVGHALGVSKIAHLDLPQKVRDRLRYGPGYAIAEVLPVAAEAQAGAKAAQSVPVRASPMADKAAAVPAQPEEAASGEEQQRKAQQRQLEGRLAVAQMKKELETLEEDLRQVGYELNFQDLSATRRYYAGQRKTTLEQQRSALQRRLNAAEIELLRLESGGAP